MAFGSDIRYLILAIEHRMTTDESSRRIRRWRIDMCHYSYCQSYPLWQLFEHHLQAEVVGCEKTICRPSKYQICFLYHIWVKLIR